jgi:hypothetical protein
MVTSGLDISSSLIVNKTRFASLKKIDSNTDQIGNNKKNTFIRRGGISVFSKDGTTSGASNRLESPNL